MKKFTIIFAAFLALLSASCSTLESKEFHEVTVAFELQKWHWCQLDQDGPALADKGWCRQGKECRERLLRKDECRPKPYFCAAGDIECIKREKLDRKVLVSQ